MARRSFGFLRFAADLVFVRIRRAGAAVERLTDAMMVRPLARDGRMNLAFAPDLASTRPWRLPDKTKFGGAVSGLADCQGVPDVNRRE